MIIPHRVSADAADILRQTAVDNRRCVGSWSPVACNPGITPSGGAVPKVFHGWIVVEIDAVNQFFASHLGQIRVANVGVIHAEAVSLGIVSHLHETADMAGPRA